MKNTLQRAVILVLDSVGIGEAPDAAEYGDEGSNTVGNTAAAVGGLHLPNLQRLGFGNLTPITGVPPTARPEAAYGKMKEMSRGKDTTTGHWELAGLRLHAPFPTYPHGFPPEIIARFQQEIGREVLGNKVASGTVIIEELGPLHLETGKPIVYTSADSVFQIASHEEIIPVDELYAMCQKARSLLQGDHAVGRVIARPFVGSPGRFARTAARKDFSLEPPQPTLLDHAQSAGVSVAAIGKISDIFAGRGISESTKTANNEETIDAIIDRLEHVGPPAILFANCVDFDALWGHRNDPVGYARGLEDVDRRIPELMASLKPGDALFIVADHGCDPTTPGTDHSRELVPLLVCGPMVKPDIPLGLRETFADVAATIAEGLSITPPPYGTSFWTDIHFDPPTN